MQYVFCFLVLSALCAGTKAQPSKHSLDAPLTMFDYPRTGTPPGYVYRIGSDKSPKFVIVLKADNLMAETLFLPKQYKHQKRKVNFFFKFLFFKTDSTVKANWDKELSYSMDIGKGIREMVDENTLDSLVTHSNIVWKEHNKYYVVQETIASDTINYTMDKNGGWAGGLDVDIPRIGEIAGGTYTYNKDSLMLRQKFSHPYRIFYTVMQITPMGTTGFVEGGAVRLTKVVTAPRVPKQP